jgi:outer membrane protein
LFKKQALFIKNLFRILFACSIASIASQAIAFDIVVPFVDPLRTTPKEIKTGITLPGDKAPVACPANVDFSAPLSLSNAVDLALCNNPQVKASWANIKVQAGVLGEAKAAYLPTLSGTVNALHSKSESAGYDNTTDGVTVFGNANWRLFDFGGRKANRQYAESLLEAALAGHGATLQKTLAAVIQAYFDAHTAKAAYEARGQAEAIAGDTLKATRHREERGAAARSDTLQAATAHARAVLDKNRAQGNYEKAISVLIYTMGIPTQTPITLADDLSASTGDYVRELNRWLADAQKKHPAILEARAQLEAAGKKIAVARSEGLPALDFTTNYFRNGYPGQAIAPNQLNSYTVGLSLSIPLFSGFSNTYKIRGAEASKEQRAAELQDTEHNVLMEVVKAYADAESSLKNLRASDDLIEAAWAALESTRRKYDKGAADILEILNAQSAMADASQERIRSLAEWNESRLRLMADSGLLGRTQILDIETLNRP